MTMRPVNLLLSAGTLFLTLVLFDRTLYPNLTTRNSLVLSGLRYFLLMFPLIIGYAVGRYRLAPVVRLMLILLWVLLLPYTIYSFAEIRHVAELCRIPVGYFYTEQCLHRAWTLIPVFIYALAGTFIFVFSVSQVTIRLFRRSWQRNVAMIGLCIYSALAGTFGLYSRLNVWESVTRPKDFFQELAALPFRDFFSNAFIVAVFYLCILFLGNYLLVWAGRCLRQHKI